MERHEKGKGEVPSSIINSFVLGLDQWNPAQKEFHGSIHFEVFSGFNSAKDLTIVAAFLLNGQGEGSNSFLSTQSRKKL